MGAIEFNCPGPQLPRQCGAFSYLKAHFTRRKTEVKLVNMRKHYKKHTGRIAHCSGCIAPAIAPIGPGNSGIECKSPDSLENFSIDLHCLYGMLDLNRRH
jgi:hypothetical protein